MRNCWIWSACLLLGGALSANAALIVGNDQTATVTQGTIGLVYDVIDLGTYYEVDVRISSINGGFAGSQIKGIEGRFTANGGGLYTAIGDPHDMTKVTINKKSYYKGDLWAKETSSSYTQTTNDPPNSYVFFDSAIGASTLSDPNNSSSPPVAINNNFGRTDTTLRTTSYLEGTWGSLTAATWNVGDYVAALYVTKETENITFTPDGFTGAAKLGYTNGQTDATQFTVGTVVPEPGTMALLLTGGLSLAGFGWRRRK